MPKQEKDLIVCVVPDSHRLFLIKALGSKAELVFFSETAGHDTATSFCETHEVGAILFHDDQSVQLRERRWHGLAQLIRVLPEKRQPKLVVASRSGQEADWLQALQLGAHDLIAVFDSDAPYELAHLHGCFDVQVAV